MCKLNEKTDSIGNKGKIVERKDYFSHFENSDKGKIIIKTIREMEYYKGGGKKAISECLHFYGRS